MDERTFSYRALNVRFPPCWRHHQKENFIFSIEIQQTYFMYHKLFANYESATECNVNEINELHTWKDILEIYLLWDM